jgi:CRP-like cAMP-binding protein
MLNLVKKARVSAQGDLSMDWLRPFMSPRKYRKGDVLFHKGDIAKEMFLTVTGKFLVTEIGVELPPGRMMGELGFVDPKNRRTQTVECIEDGDVLTITYEKLLELYFQNQEFGYYFLRLTTERLMQNIARLEGVIAASKADGETVPAPVRQIASSATPASDIAVETKSDATEAADFQESPPKAATS